MNNKTVLLRDRKRRTACAPRLCVAIFLSPFFFVAIFVSPKKKKIWKKKKKKKLSKKKEKKNCQKKKKKNFQKKKKKNFQNFFRGRGRGRTPPDPPPENIGPWDHPRPPPPPPARPPPPLWTDTQSENITFARFAKRAVKKLKVNLDLWCNIS